MSVFIRITAFLFACILTIPASAEVWLVDSNTRNAADFRDLQSAHDAASAGDTLYVRGSSVTYTGDLTLEKQLVIIGPGYFLHEYPDSQSNDEEAVISSGTFFLTKAQKDRFLPVSNCLYQLL